MATSRFLLAVLSVCLLLQDTVAIKNRRLRKQLVEFIAEMRRELKYIHADIFELFETNKNRSKMEMVVNPDAPKDGGFIVNAEDFPKAAYKGNQEKIDKEMLQKYEHLLRAFQSEKRINRHLKQRLESFEKRVTDQLNSTAEMSSVKEYVDQSIDKKVLKGIQIVNESNVKIAEDLRNISGDFLIISENVDTIKTDVKNISNFVKDLEETVDEVNKSVNAVEQSIQHMLCSNNCKDVPKSGTYYMYIESMQTTVPVYCDQDTDGGGYMYIESMQTTVPVYCDQDIDGGGWVVILRRQDGSGDFNRSWAEYKEGFGDREGEFWAGNELIHQLTISKPTQLRIDMETFHGESKFAQYGDFQIGPEEDKYRLKSSDYAGTAGDSGETNNGQPFSTLDRDNDYARRNCAERDEGGWWYSECGRSYLTSRYSYTGDISGDYIGIIWETLTGWNRSLKFVEMKIRTSI